MKSLSKVALATLLAASLIGCSSETSATTTEEEDTSTSEVEESTSSEETVYHVGICQLVQHDALDAATQGFEETLTEEFGDNVIIDEQNAAGDAATCSTIVNSFVSNDYDLIMANATAALQAAAAATSTIPVLGTSVTEYGVALDIDDFSGTVGTNVSGTSDLAPLSAQADMFEELLPEATNIGILYCSAEPNSVYQVQVVTDYLEAQGKTVTPYAFSDSNDVTSVTQSAVANCDALYIPTDNTAASCTEAIDNVARPAGVPIIAGEEGICDGCGIATLSISYYDLGVKTGEMAISILKGEEDVSTMAISYADTTTKKYDAERCAELGIEVPSDYVAIEE